jgi:cell division protein FtsW
MDSYNFYADRPREQYNRSDTAFIVSVILLLGLGIFTLYVCSADYAMRLFKDPSYFVKRQLVSAAAGIILYAVFCSLDMRIIRKMLPAMVTGTLVLCFLTFIPVIGIERNGASRWIRLPFSFTFQPSEAVKFVVVLFLANLFDKQINTKESSVFPAAAGLIIFVSVIFCQKDFSTGVFIFFVGIMLFFVTGSKLSWLAPFSLIAIPACSLMIFMEQYRVNRLIAFLKPQEDIQGINYQSFASRRAINAGGFWGQGIGTGLAHVGAIPEVQADYIFAGWTEAMGLIGVFIYVLLLCFFAWRVFRIALVCRDRFAAISTFGFALMIFLQSLLNIAVVCGVVPATGIPLPFFSSGGSSVIFTLAMCGFIVNASRCDLDSETGSESLRGVEVYE